MPKIAFLSQTTLADTVPSIKWESTQALLDFEALIVDAGSYFFDLDAQNVSRKASVLWDRVVELKDYAAHDRPIVFLLRYTPMIRYMSGGHAYSCDPDNALYALELLERSGSNIALAENTPGNVRDFFGQTKSMLNFKAVIPKAAGRPLFLIKDATAVLGCVSNIFNNDKTFLFPHFSSAALSNFAEKKIIENAFSKFFESLINTKKETAFSLPTGHEKFNSLVEKDLLDGINSLTERKKLIDEEIAKKNQALENERMLKHLFLSNGDALAEAARLALLELGFNVSPGPIGRDDLVCDDEIPPIVIEVKGREARSAAEADSAQLEKWAASYMEAKGIEPKPLLIMNGFFKTDPMERTESVFPHQMMKYATQRNHALIAGIDLYRLLQWSRTAPEQKKDIKLRITQAVGIVDMGTAPIFPDIF